jgi:hypothetical protein
VDLSGGVACADPHRLHAETTLTTLDTAADLPDVLQALAPVKAEMEGNFKAGCFSGSFAVYGPPDCVGTFSACAQEVSFSPDAGL